MEKIQENKKQICLWVILNILFTISYAALFLLIYNKFRAPSETISNILKYTFLCISVILVSVFLFTKNRWGKIDIKKSKVLDMFTVITWLGFISVLLNYYTNSSKKKMLLVVFASLALLVLCYFLVNFIYSFIKNFIDSLSTFEKKLTIIFVAVGIVTTTVLFLITKLFVYPPDPWDNILSFDTGYFIKNNISLNIFGASNDARHILMTIALMPFGLYPYMISNLLSISEAVYGLLIAYMQVLVVVYCLIKIIKLLKIENKTIEVLMMTAMFLASSMFINMINVEKFIFSMFYIVTTISLTVENSKFKWLFLGLSIGILTTNIALLPIVLFYEKQPAKKYLKQFLAFCGGFLCIVIMLGQFNLIIYFKSSLDAVMVYSAKSGTYNFIQRIMQYLTCLADLYFIPNYILSGRNIIQAPFKGDILMYVGIIILLISIVSVILNRKDKFAWLCAYWQLFMFLLLAVVGWGSTLNEMFLYSAAFGWSTFPLVFMFFKKIIKNKTAQICVFAAAIFAISLINIIQFAGIMKVAVEFYPSVII